MFTMITFRMFYSKYTCSIHNIYYYYNFISGVFKTVLIHSMLLTVSVVNIKQKTRYMYVSCVKNINELCSLHTPYSNYSSYHTYFFQYLRLHV